MRRVLRGFCSVKSWLSRWLLLTKIVMERKNNYHKYNMLWSYPLEQILKWVLMISARGANQRTQTVTIWPITGEDPEPSLAPSHYLMWSVECHKNLWLSQLAASLNYIMLMLHTAHIFVQHIFNPLKIPIDPTTLAVFQWYSWQRNHFFRPDENQFVCPFDQSVVGKCSMSRVTDWQEKKNR